MKNMEIQVKYSFHKNIFLKIIHFSLSENGRHKKHPKTDNNEFLSHEKDSNGIFNCFTKLYSGSIRWFLQVTSQKDIDELIFAFEFFFQNTKS